MLHDNEVRPDDFLTDGALDDLGLATPVLRWDFVDTIRSSPIAEEPDIELAVSLARLAHQELIAYGTGGGQRLNAEEIELTLRALKALLARLGVVGLDIPFRDYASFYDWWIQNGARGSWQARRDLLEGVFGPIHDRLAEIEQNSLEVTLVDPISPHKATGWAAVDIEVSELRRHFSRATTPQDYRNVGLDCVAVTEALSRQVYDPGRHLRPGETEPPVGNTKQRIERFIDDALSGAGNAAYRKLGRTVVDAAQQVKHSETPTRKEAGLAADAVIQLANFLRRLSEPD